MSPLTFSHEIRRLGGDTRHIERAATRGETRRVRPGAYVSAAEWDALGERERHILRMRAVDRTFSSRPVFSHESAAALWGIPIVGAWPDFVTVSYDSSHGMSHRRGMRCVRARWEPNDVTEIGALRVTSPSRTVVDIARSSSAVRGVVALDHAFQNELADRAQVADWLRSHRPFPGARSLDAALAIASGRSESPLESVSMVRFSEAGLSAPVQQHEIRVGSERYRVDFFWPELDLVGEADGRSKYATPDDLWREKRREDRIREVVGRFVRWSWAEAWAGEPLIALLTARGAGPARRL